LWVIAPGYEELKVRVELTLGQPLRRDIELRSAAKPYAYRVETVPLPQQMIPEVSSIAFSPTGSLVMTNRRGDVWIRDQKGWRRFAGGLYEGFGVVAASDSEIFVLQRPEITRLVDTNGDGVADRYETFADGWGITGNYHEFSYGLARDRAGNFFGGFGMASAGDFPWVRGPLKEALVVPLPNGKIPADPHRSVAKYQGWAFRVDRDGTFVPLATGLRQPLGVGVSPQDELFVTDVSGAWVPTSLLHHVEAGSFYGHPDGLKWHPDFKDKPVTYDMLVAMRRPPTAYLPRGLMGGSPGQPAWDTSGGKFGPYAGQMFLGDVTALVMRVDLEKVGGAYQGAAFPFIRGQGLGIGGMHNAFGPDGAFYIAQTVRGWMSTEGGEGIQRVVWTGENPVDVQHLRLTTGGFSLYFTEPMAAPAGDAASYRIRRFQYNYHIQDGSLRRNEVEVPIKASRFSSDQRTVELDLQEMQPDYIYEFEITAPLTSRKGRALLNPIAYYTANRLLPGTIVAPTTLVAQAVKLQPPDFSRGEQIFRLNCMVCHQADGKGSKQVGTPDYTAANGPLTRPDADLLAVITGGKNQMPAFGNVLPSQAIHDVLYYIKKNFGWQSR
jgi:cytochrome c5